MPGRPRAAWPPLARTMAAMRILCLGEALVDLVAERPAVSATDVDAFVPHFGGAMANAAVHAARRGADVALCGGVGDDAWGSWLVERLAKERVNTPDLVQAPGLQTPLALVTVSDRAEPTFAIYGSTTGSGSYQPPTGFPTPCAEPRFWCSPRTRSWVRRSEPSRSRRAIRR